jgi:maltose/moltooligosaccharide transporter
MASTDKKRSNAFYALLSLPSTAMGFALCIQISALSWILSTKYQLAIHEVGYVWLAGPLAGLLAQPVVGLISDSVWIWGGRRRPFIIVGGVLASLMLLALPFLGELSRLSGIGILWVAIAVALLLDLAINVGFNPTRSIIADLTEEGEERTKGFTWMQTISGGFAVLAYVVGATLGNYALIFLGVGLVALFNVGATLLIEEPRDLRAAPADHPEEPGGRPGRTRTGKLFHIYAAHGFTWLGVQTMFVFMFAFVKHAIKLPDLTDAKVGEIIAVAFLVLNTVGFVLPVLVLQPVAKRIGLVRTHACCIAVMACGYAAIFGAGHTPLALYGLMAVVGIGWAATVSLPFAIMSDNVDQSRMGLFMGLFNLSVVIPQLVASAFFGKLIDAAPNKDRVFLIAAAALAVSAVLWFFVEEDRAEFGTKRQSPAMPGTGHA